MGKASEHPAALRFVGELYEIVAGRMVEVVPMSAYEGRLANRLAYHVNVHAIPGDLGEANVENLFRLPPPAGHERRPDVAFVSRQRWPKNRPMAPEQLSWDVVPNIAVETVAPSDFSSDLMDKIDEYFAAGVELVWIVHPRQRKIYVYNSPLSIRVLTVGDTLDGGKVLPEFRLPLQDFFD